MKSAPADEILGTRPRTRPRVPEGRGETKPILFPATPPKPLYLPPSPAEDRSARIRSIASDNTGRSLAAIIPLSISDSTNSTTASPRAPASRATASETVTVICMVDGSPASIYRQPNPQNQSGPAKILGLPAPVLSPPNAGCPRSRISDLEINAPRREPGSLALPDRER